MRRTRVSNAANWMKRKNRKQPQKTERWRRAPENRHGDQDDEGLQPVRAENGRLRAGRDNENQTEFREEDRPDRPSSPFARPSARHGKASIRFDYEHRDECERRQQESAARTCASREFALAPQIGKTGSPAVRLPKRAGERRPAQRLVACGRQDDRDNHGDNPDSADPRQDRPEGRIRVHVKSDPWRARPRSRLRAVVQAGSWDSDAARAATVRVERHPRAAYTGRDANRSFVDVEPDPWRNLERAAEAKRTHPITVVSDFVCSHWSKG